jgi:hypothetical protein
MLNHILNDYNVGKQGFNLLVCLSAPTIAEEARVLRAWKSGNVKGKINKRL